MEIECNVKVDIDEVISNCDYYKMVELCQNIFDALDDKLKQEFLHNNFDEIETDDIKELYQERVEE